jgi:hypothetical protein
MKNVLLAAAGSLAALALPAPAEAQSWGQAGLTAGPAFAGVTVHRGGPSGFHGSFGSGRGDFKRDHGDRRRHDRRRDREFFVGGPWGYYDDQDRTFEPDSYNDWWHERPWRSYPRWVQNNQNCEADRMWWSGSGWHC